MHRRRFIQTVAGSLVGVPIAIKAQPAARIYRIGYLSPGAYQPGQDLDSFRRGLLELGWSEDRNIVILARWSGPTNDTLPALALELAALAVDVIVTISSPAALAAQKATSSIPIVMAGSSDPVRRGLVASLAHPAGNVTGMTNNPGAGLLAKRLQLLKEAAPKVSRLALVWDPTNLGDRETFRAVQDAAPGLGIVALSNEARDIKSIPAALAAALHQRADSLYVTANALNLGERDLIADFAIANRLPSIFEDRRFVSAGGLMSYSTDWLELRRRSAVYVDKILRGEKAGDLAIEQPDKYELVINSSTVKALNLTLPQSIRVLAVVE